MDVRTVEALLKARGWNHSELARKVGVSRQAVSLWFQKGGRAALRSPHFLRLGDALGVPAEQLARPLPCLGEERARLCATLLWDGLYPDLDDFAIAANKGEPRAIARLLEVYGLYPTAKMIGNRVWNDFPRYARYIHPARRRQLETLYRWNRRRTASYIARHDSERPPRRRFSPPAASHSLNDQLRQDRLARAPCRRTKIAQRC